jgi:hypothetical protein
MQGLEYYPLFMLNKAHQSLTTTALKGHLKLPFLQLTEKLLVHLGSPQSRYHQCKNIDSEELEMLVPGAISNVCAVTYRVQGLPAQDALKTANLKAVRFGARISSECA